MTDWTGFKLTNPTAALDPNTDWSGFKLTTDAEKEKKKPQRTLVGTLGDVGVTALKGAIGVPEAAVGLADLVTGGKAGKTLEGIGFKPKEAKQILDENYSDAQKEAQSKVANAQGFVDTTAAAIQNPSTIATAIGESLPSMLAGGVAGRGIGALAKLGESAAPYLAGAGEGLVGAGMSAENIRQQTDDGLLTNKQAAIAAGSGALTGLIGAGSNRLAKELGITEFDTLAAGGRAAENTANKGLVRRVGEGALTEGALEELPQSTQEQIAQNVALNKDPMEGVGNAAAMGLLTGGVMGGGMGVLHNPKQQPQPAPTITPEEPQQPVNQNVPPVDPIAPIDNTQPIAPVQPQPQPQQSSTYPNEIHQDGVATPARPSFTMDLGGKGLAPIIPERKANSPIHNSLVAGVEAEAASYPKDSYQDDLANVPRKPNFTMGVNDGMQVVPSNSPIQAAVSTVQERTDKDGFPIREYSTPEQIAQQRDILAEQYNEPPKRVNVNGRVVDTEKHNLAQAINLLGGINKQDADAIYGGSVWTENSNKGNLFRNNDKGLSLGEAHEKLIDLGYLPPDSTKVTDVIELLRSNDPRKIYSANKNNYGDIYKQDAPQTLDDAIKQSDTIEQAPEQARTLDDDFSAALDRIKPYVDEDTHYELATDESLPIEQRINFLNNLADNYEKTATKDEAPNVADDRIQYTDGSTSVSDSNAGKVDEVLKTNKYLEYNDLNDTARDALESNKTTNVDYLSQKAKDLEFGLNVELENGTINPSDAQTMREAIDYIHGRIEIAQQNKESTNATQNQENTPEREENITSTQSAPETQASMVTQSDNSRSETQPILNAKNEPFSKEILAKNALKKQGLTETHEVSKIDGGYAIVEKSILSNQNEIGRNQNETQSTDAVSIPEAQTQSYSQSINRQQSESYNQKTDAHFSDAVKGIQDQIAIYEDKVAKSPNDKRAKTELDNLNRKLKGATNAWFVNNYGDEYKKEIYDQYNSAKTQQEKDAAYRKITDFEDSNIIDDEFKNRKKNESVTQGDVSNSGNETDFITKSQPDVPETNFGNMAQSGVDTSTTPKKEPLPLDKIKQIISANSTKSIHEFDVDQELNDLINESRNDFKFLIDQYDVRNKNASDAKIAERIAETHDLSNPKNMIAYSVLSHSGIDNSDKLASDFIANSPTQKTKGRQKKSPVDTNVNELSGLYSGETEESLKAKIESTNQKILDLTKQLQNKEITQSEWREGSAKLKSEKDSLFAQYDSLNSEFTNTEKRSFTFGDVYETSDGILVTKHGSDGSRTKAYDVKTGQFNGFYDHDQLKPVSLKEDYSGEIAKPVINPAYEQYKEQQDKLAEQDRAAKEKRRKAHEKKMESIRAQNEQWKKQDEERAKREPVQIHELYEPARHLLNPEEFNSLSEEQKTELHDAIKKEDSIMDSSKPLNERLDEVSPIIKRRKELVDIAKGKSIEPSEGVKALQDLAKLAIPEETTDIYNRSARSEEKTALVAKAGVTGLQIQTEKQRPDLPTFAENDNIKSLGFDAETIKNAEHLINNLTDSALQRKQAMLDEVALAEDLERLAKDKNSGITIEEKENGSKKYTLNGLSFTRRHDEDIYSSEEQSKIDAIRAQLVEIGGGQWTGAAYSLHVQPLDGTVSKMQDKATAKAQSIKSTEDKFKAAAEARKSINLLDSVIAKLKSVFYALFNPKNKAPNNDDKTLYKWRSADGSTMFTMQKGKGKFTLTEGDNSIKGATPNEKRANIAKKQELVSAIDAITKGAVKRSVIRAKTSGVNKPEDIDGVVINLLSDNPVLKAMFENDTANEFRGFSAAAVIEPTPPVTPTPTSTESNVNQVKHFSNNDILKERKRLEDLEAQKEDSDSLNKAIINQGYAHRSHSNMVEIENKWFDNSVKNYRESLEKHARNEAQKGMIDGFVSEFKKEYVKRRHQVLKIGSSVVSSHIAGRNNFNLKQANSRGSSLDKAEENFNNWLKNSDYEAIKQIKDARTSDEVQADNDAAKKAEIKKLVSPILNDLAMMGAIDAGQQRGMDRGSFSQSAARKIEKLHKAGNTEALNKIFDQIQIYDESHKKPLFLKNSRVWEFKATQKETASNSKQDAPATTQEGNTSNLPDTFKVKLSDNSTAQLSPSDTKGIYKIDFDNGKKDAVFASSVQMMIDEGSWSIVDEPIEKAPENKQVVDTQPTPESSKLPEKEESHGVTVFRDNKSYFETERKLKVNADDSVIPMQAMGNDKRSLMLADKLSNVFKGKYNNNTGKFGYEKIVSVNVKDDSAIVIDHDGKVKLFHSTENGDRWFYTANITVDGIKNKKKEPDYSYFIKIAADSIDKLRKDDVYRVLESAGKENRDNVANYIKDKREDLTNEVDDSIKDLKKEDAKGKFYNDYSQGLISKLQYEIATGNVHVNTADSDTIAREIINNGHSLGLDNNAVQLAHGFNHAAYKSGDLNATTAMEFKRFYSYDNNLLATLNDDIADVSIAGMAKHLIEKFNNRLGQHIENGKATPATPAEITKSLKTGDANSKRSFAEIKADLLSQIDEAIAKAKEWTEKTGEIKNLDKERYYFDVIGDGKFRVTNTVEALEAFKSNVNKQWNKERTTNENGTPVKLGYKKYSAAQIDALKLIDTYIKESNTEYKKAETNERVLKRDIDLDKAELARNNANKARQDQIKKNISKWERDLENVYQEAYSSMDFAIQVAEHAEVSGNKELERFKKILDDAGYYKEPTKAEPEAPKPDSVDAKDDGVETTNTVVINTMKAHDDFNARVNNGEVTASEFKAAFESVVENKDAIIADLNKLTKPQLISEYPALRIRQNENKDYLLKTAYSSMLDSFNLSGVLSYGFGESKENAIRQKVEATTDEMLKAHAQEIADARERRAKEKEDRKAGIENPQTLEDFRNAHRTYWESGNYSTQKEARVNFTQEQLERYDLLMAQESRGKRKSTEDRVKSAVKATATTTDGRVIEGTHTKTGEKIFTVKAADRVDTATYQQWNSTAKRLGGYYSRFGGGFIFKTNENANAFLAYLGGNTESAKDAISQRRNALEDDSTQSTIERLREMADRMESDADDSLNQDRKANTHRRARQAASAESAANTLKATAKTMRKIAEAIEANTANLLDGVRAKTHVELLQSITDRAKWQSIQAIQKGKSWTEIEQLRAKPATKDVAEFVEYPVFKAWQSDLATLARKLLDNEGTKKIGKQLFDLADDKSKEYEKFAKENLEKVTAFAKRNSNGTEEKARFSSKDVAEKAIKKFGLSDQAIVLSVSKGDNLIILSPAEAIKRGIWQGQDKLITLPSQLGDDLIEKVGRNKKFNIPYSFDNIQADRKRLSAMNIETSQELRAAIREFIDLREPPKAPDRIKELERAMVGRQNDGLDFFPTPAPVVQSMLDSADIKEGMSVLEPSAGMGHIADLIREQTGVEPDVIELSNKRRELLEAKGHNVVGSDFLEFTSDTKYDRIIMNPPFGDRRDAVHIRHAYKQLAKDGRLVAIVGEGVFFGNDAKAKEFRNWLEKVGGTEEKLENGSFNDPSLPVTTGANARMVVIDKGMVDDEVVESPESDAPILINDKTGEPETRATFEGIHNEFVVYSGGDGKGGKRYALQSERNKEKGEFVIGFGDALFSTLEDAIKQSETQNYFYKDRLAREEKANADKAQKAESLIKINSDDINGFLNNKDEKTKALIRKALDKAYNFDGEILSTREFIEGKNAKGELKVWTRTENAIKDKTRVEWNRMGKYEQEQHEKRQRKAGTKTVYLVNGHEFGKIPFDYAQHLLDSGSEIKPSKTTTQANAYTKESLSSALQNAADKEFGKGWFSRLLATGKFEIINRDEIDGVIGKNAKFHKAWHGSAHDFHRFKMSEIGTGAGAQLYGHGLYFTDSRDVAEYYRGSASTMRKYHTISNSFLNEGNKTPFTVDGVKYYYDTDEKSHYQQDNNRGLTNKITRELFEKKEKQHLERLKKGGTLFEVELAPTQDEYLDWHKALKDQSPLVQKILSAISDKNKTGREIYESLGSPEMASIKLRKAGIRGTKFLDISSKRDGEPVHNYVIFDDKDISIEAKYSKNGDIQAFYNPKDGKTYFVADGIEKSTDLIGLLKHEIGVHALNMGKDDAGFKSILKQLESMRGKSAAVDEAFKSAERAGTSAENMAEEALGYFVEKNPKHKLTDRIIAWFKSMVNKLFGNNTLTEQDLHKMAREALRKAPDELALDAVEPMGLKFSKTQPTQDEYSRNRELVKSPLRHLKDTAKRFGGEFVQGSGNFLAGARTRLEAISPKLGAKYIELERNIATREARLIKAATPFMNKTKTMTKEDAADFDFAMKNGYAAKINEIVDKYQMQSEYNAVQSVLSELRNDAFDVGLIDNKLMQLFPRALRDVDGFIDAMGEGAFTKRLNEYAAAQGIAPDELAGDLKANLINSMIESGYHGTGENLEAITPELNQFFLNTNAAILGHIHNTSKHIEYRKFLGKIPAKIAKIRTELGKINSEVSLQNRLMKEAQTDEAKESARQKRDALIGNAKQLEVMLGKYLTQRDYRENVASHIMKLIADGEIKPHQERIVQEILNARLHERGATGIVAAYKNLALIDTMGSPISAITQLGDFTWALYESGNLFGGLKAIGNAIRGKAVFDRTDYGLERIAQEFTESDTFAGAVDKVFGLVGIKKVTGVASDSLLNAISDKLTRQANTGDTRLMKKLETYFGNDAQQVLNDLKNGVINDNTRLMIYSRYLDFAPVTLSELPTKYQTAGNGRVFYMLKSYTLKLFDVYRREAVQEIFSGDKARAIQGMKNLAMILSLLMLTGAGADELKDWILGRNTDFEDRVVDNLWKLAGLSKFITWEVRREGVGTAAFKQIMPPFAFINNVGNDVIHANDIKRHPKDELWVNGLDTTKSIPVVGKIYYWQIGRGTHAHKELSEIRFEKEKKRLDAVKDEFEQLDNSEKKDFLIEHKDDLAKLKQANHIQARLNKVQSLINRQRAMPKSEVRNTVIEKLEKQREVLMGSFLK